MNASQQTRAAGLGAWQERAEQETPSPEDYDVPEENRAQPCTCTVCHKWTPDIRFHRCHEVPSPADYEPQVFAHCIRCGAFTEIVERGVCWHCVEHSMDEPT